MSKNNSFKTIFNAVRDMTNSSIDGEVKAGLLSNNITFSQDSDFNASTDEGRLKAGILNDSIKGFSQQLRSGLLSHSGMDEDASHSVKLTKAQEIAGFLGQYGCITDTNSIYNAGNLSLNASEHDKVKMTQQVDDGLVIDNFNDLKAGNLAFSTEDNMNASQFTTLINIALAKQEDMIERFFPTVVIDPKESGFKASVKYASFTSEWTRDINDDRSVREKMGLKSIIKNIFNSEILGEDRTRVIPVYRSKFDSHLVKEIQDVETCTGEQVTTAPYKFNAKCEILKMSQTDEQMSKGVMDQTDSLLPNITLSNIYVGMTIGSQAMKFKLDVSSHPGANFGFIGTGHFKGLQLIFEERPITLNFGSDTTKQVAGVNIPSQVKEAIESALTSSHVQNGSWKNYRFTFLVTITGTSNIESAETTLYANSIRLGHITDDMGNELDLKSGLGKALHDVVSDLKLIGYDLIAYRSNTNLRTKGRMIHIDEYTSYLVAPWRGPFQVMGPITRHTGTECDYDHVGTLITCITAASDVHGMLALEKYADALRLRSKNPEGISEIYDFQFNDQLVNVYFRDKTLNLTDHVDSLMSHKRLIDVQAALLNELRLSCLQMLLDSNYLLAYNVLYRQNGQKPIILIGTDPIIKEFLLYGNEGSNVIPGVNFDIVVDSTLNPRIKGKMYVTMTLGKEVGDLNGVQALNFGYRLHSIAVTATINPETSGDRTAMRTVIIPRYHHIPLLPIMMVYQVTGIPESIKKLPVLTK